MQSLSRRDGPERPGLEFRQGVTRLALRGRKAPFDETFERPAETPRASTACRVYIFLADPYEMERSKGLAAPFSYDFLSKAYERGPEVAPPEPFPYEITADSYEKGARIVISRYAGQRPEPKL